MTFRKFGFFILALGILWPISSRAWSDDSASMMADADAAYAKRSDVPEAKIAWITYQRAPKMDPQGVVEASWKASRAAWWLGQHADSRDDKLKYFQSGITLAQNGVTANPDSVEAHFWLGVNLGAYGETKGIFKSLSMVKPIRQQMADVLRIDEHYLNGGAYRVLGVVDYKVPGIVGGNRTRAKEELEKALAMGPNDPFTHFYLAEFSKLTGDQARMQSELATLKTLQVPADIQPELEMLQARAADEFKS